MLALVISQGASLNNSMWYINYMAVVVILLTCIALALSYLSVPVSHSFCETIFLTIYTPASQIFNITISIRDVHEDEATRRDRLAKQEPSGLLKQSLLVSTMLAASYGLTLTSMVYFTIVTAAFKCLSNQLKIVLPVKDEINTSSSIEVPTRCYMITPSALVLLSVFVHSTGFTGALTLLYFVITDAECRNFMKKLVENKGVERMEGLEQYFTEGLLQLSEVMLTISAIIYNPCLCLIYIPTVYFNIYCPSLAFRVNCRKIRAESLCLSNFQKATQQDIQEYDDVCAVCLSNMTHARVTPCKHIFHGKCLKDCLQKKAQCPMCNTQIL